MTAATDVRTIVLRVAALALLLLLVLVGVLTIRTMSRLPTALVYFVDSEPTGFSLQAVGRRLEGRTTEARLRAAVEALIAGPSEAEAGRGLSTTIPEDTRLLGLELQDGTVTVNLSEEFEAGGGSAMMIGRLNQLFYTVTQPRGVERAVLEIAGEPVELFGGEGLIVERPWRRPAGDALPTW